MKRSISFAKKSLIIILLFYIITMFIDINMVNAESNEIMEGVQGQLKVDGLIDEMEGYLENSEMKDSLDISELITSIMSGEKIENTNLIQKLLDGLSLEIIKSIKSGIQILIIIVCMGIFSSLDIDKDGEINKIVYLVSFLIIVTLLSTIYIEVISGYEKIVTTLCNITQTITPFMMIVLIASGGTITASLVQPLILFIASLVGFLINYICLPFITISVVMKIVSSLGDNIKLERLGNLFSKSSIWVCSVIFTLFLAYITAKGSVTTSVDTVAIKTTQTALSNFVPVVGKFVSDSLESIMGATEVIGKAAGVIGIIVIILITIVPIIKLLVVMVCHKVLASLTETITDNKKMINIIDAFGDTYKTLLRYTCRNSCTIYSFYRCNNKINGTN